MTRAAPADRGVFEAASAGPAAAALLVMMTSPLAARADAPAAIEDLSQMSLRELADVQVTSVLKSAEPVSRAPAAIYVITHDDIVRSGATRLVEVLRLAPNMRVTQLGSSNYTATARGFGGNQADQNFANKLLILIDGRTVYNPLFSGIYFDAQDVVLDDVERIEVISGPGATLWGANAVNGVINVITRPAYLSDGALLEGAAGNRQRELSGRYGGKQGEVAYRLYGLAFDRDALQIADGSSAHDAWSKEQGGFRTDWSHDRDTLTAQGDIYHGAERQPGTADLLIDGGNVLARWQHHGRGSNFQAQVYIDQTQRTSAGGGAGFVLHTFDAEIQQSVALGSRHNLVFGAGERLNRYGVSNSIGPVTSLLFEPTSRSLTLGNLFAQDTVSLTNALQLTVGIKLEDDPFSGWSFLPDARVSWDLGERSLLWAAASRAIRAPTPFDVDVIEKVEPTVFLTGNPRFRPERVSAYELGYRSQIAAALTLSISTFYNFYDDLRTIEPASSSTFLPLHWGNLMDGHTYGVEAWANWQVLSWWRLSPGVATLHKDLQFRPGASTLLGLAQAGDDPSARLLLTSSMNLPHHLTFDATLRHVRALPDPALPAYTELSSRFGWRVSRALELALSGENLLHSRHYEYPAPGGEAIVRSVFAQARWTP